MVTRGPGATHASTGVHTAMQDSTPLVLLVGQVPREHRGREAFQEIDYEQMFGRVAKWVFEIDRRRADPRARRARLRDGGRGPARARRALAARGRALGDDRRCRRRCPCRARAAAPAAADLARMRELLARSRAPARDRRRSGWTPEGCGRPRGAFLVGGRHPGGGLVPLPGRDRQPPSGLLRRSRAGRQPGAGAAACARPTSCSRSARGSRRPRPAATRSSRRRRRVRRSCTCTRTPAELGQRLPPGARHRLGAARVRRRGARARAGRQAAATRAGRAAARSDYEDVAQLRPGAGRRRRLAAVARAPARAAARRDRRQRRGQLHGLGAPLLAVLPLPLAARAALGRDGLRRPGGRGGQARPPRAAGRRVRGRRLLPDVRAGARDDGRRRSCRCS